MHFKHLPTHSQNLTKIFVPGNIKKKKKETYCSNTFVLCLVLTFLRAYPVTIHFKFRITSSKSFANGR